MKISNFKKLEFNRNTSYKHWTVKYLKNETGVMNIVSDWCWKNVPNVIYRDYLMKKIRNECKFEKYTPMFIKRPMLNNCGMEVWFLYSPCIMINTILKYLYIKNKTKL